MSRRPWAVADPVDVYGSSRCLRDVVFPGYIHNDSKKITYCDRTVVRIPPYRLIRLIVSNVLCRLAPVLEIEPLSETIHHAQRKEVFVLGARARLPCSLRNGSVR